MTKRLSIILILPFTIISVLIVIGAFISSSQVSLTKSYDVTPLPFVVLFMFIFSPSIIALWLCVLKSDVWFYDSKLRNIILLIFLIIGCLIAAAFTSMTFINLFENPINIGSYILFIFFSGPLSVGVFQAYRVIKALTSSSSGRQKHAA